MCIDVYNTLCNYVTQKIQLPPNIKHTDVFENLENQYYNYSLHDLCKMHNDHLPLRCRQPFRLFSWNTTWSGFLGFLETPWGSPRFFPSFYSLQNDCGHACTCLPNVAFSKLANAWILTATTLYRLGLQI